MMSYPGRQNIYAATIRRMVTAALEEQERQFRREHEADADEALLERVRQWARERGRAPWAAEMVGGSYLLERFGSWERVLRLAGLPDPKATNRPQSSERYRQEELRQKENYRLRKAEKKQLAQKRLADQAAKRRARKP